MFLLVEILLVFVVILFVWYKYKTRSFKIFDEKNVPHEKPYLWVNNFPGTFTGSESVVETLVRFHTKFKNEKIYGLIDMFGPVIVLRDPELIKQVTVKDFDHFVNHRTFVTDKDDKMFGNSIFQMRNEKWRDMRSTLTPAFTGNKMRIMFDLIRECCEETNAYLRGDLKSHPNGKDLELRDLFTRFTNDVIATCAFGLKVNSLVDRNNKFYLMGKKVNTFDFAASIRFFLIANFPALCRIVGMSLFDKEHVNYFKSLVLDSMKYREEHNIVRPDIINMLMETKKATEKKREWTDDEMVAQCFGFFMAGFETTGTTMCFAAYELVVNPEIQDKLIAEVDEVREQLNGKPLTYDVLQNMKYMDMMISETLRKWPGAPFSDRVCTKKYTLHIDEEHQIEMNPGDAFSMNIFGTHYDPVNFPDPEKFIPERFNEENKANIKPYTYLPFGVGPRNCIGNRFALMEMKASFYYLLSEFRFEATKKTVIPIELDKRGFQMRPKGGGFWLKLRSRK